MSSSDFPELVEAAERTNRLLALILTRGLKQRDAISLLDKAGLSPKQIAFYLGTTGNTVSVALSKQRKKGKAGVVSAGESDAEIS